MLASYHVAKEDDPLEREAEQKAKEMIVPSIKVKALNKEEKQNPGKQKNAVVAKAPKIEKKVNPQTPEKQSKPLQATERAQEEMEELVEEPLKLFAAANQPPPLNLRQHGIVLPDPEKMYFETQFGQDLSHVRIHHDEQAVAIAEQLNAKAFTIGNHIMFGASQYKPETTPGKELLAHELTHVNQPKNIILPSAMVYRTACGHDGDDVLCYFGFRQEDEETGEQFNPPPGSTYITEEDESGQTFQRLVHIDSYIVDVGLRTYFPGNWVTQVVSPPNTVKGGRERGLIDGMKVNDNGGVLNLEVVEIKSRALQNGGCDRATREAREYQRILNYIAPQVIHMSRVFASRQPSGFRLSNSNNRPRYNLRAAERAFFEQNGIDLSQPRWLGAWRFYNCLQHKRNRTYTQAFSAMHVSLNTDGSPSVRYLVASIPSASCPAAPGQPATRARREIHFMVNGAGGVSYGCDDNCPGRRRRPNDRRHRFNVVRAPGSRPVQDPQQVRGPVPLRILDLDGLFGPMQPMILDELNRTPTLQPNHSDYYIIADPGFVQHLAQPTMVHNIQLLVAPTPVPVAHRYIPYIIAGGGAAAFIAGTFVVMAAVLIPEIIAALGTTAVVAESAAVSTGATTTVGTATGTTVGTATTGSASSGVPTALLGLAARQAVARGISSQIGQAGGGMILVMGVAATAEAQPGSGVSFELLRVVPRSSVTIAENDTSGRCAYNGQSYLIVGRATRCSSDSCREE